MIYKTTKAHLSTFTDAVEHWQYYFGLINWELTVVHESYREAMAWCSAGSNDKVCSIGLAKEWEEKPTELELNKKAFHEVCELLLWDLGDHVGVNHSDEIVSNLKHDVIRRLENTIFKDAKTW